MLIMVIVVVVAVAVMMMALQNKHYSVDDNKPEEALRQSGYSR